LLRAAKPKVAFLSIEPLLEDIGRFNLEGIDWVIVGGESGPGARLLDPAWVNRIQKLCKKQRTAFFFKQWGGVQKSKTGRLLNGRTYDEMPERIVGVMPPRKTRLAMAEHLVPESARWQGKLVMPPAVA